MKTHPFGFAAIAAILLSTALVAAPPGATTSQQPPLPRTADGKPDLQGIWQASSTQPQPIFRIMSPA